MGLEVLEELGDVAAGVGQSRGGEPRGARIAGGDGVEGLEEQVDVGDAEDGEDVVGRDVGARVGDELLERAERVAERAGRVAGEQRDGVGRDLDRLRGGDARDDGGDLLDRRAGEVEAVAAVDHRRQDLLRLGRGEDEDRVRRRLLERLEERVPRLRGQHVRLVEDVDLRTPGHRRELHGLAQLADVVDRVVRRRVHLDDVQRRRAGDRDARLALPAGLDRRPVLAVHARREHLRHRRLARPPRAHEQVGMVDLALLDGIAQGPHDMLLAHDVRERSRAVAAVQRGAGGHVVRV